MWNSAMELFRDYMGTGWIIGFFMVAVVYLFFAETDKAKRLLFIYIPVVLLLLYFNPLFVSPSNHPVNTCCSFTSINCIFLNFIHF